MAHWSFKVHSTRGQGRWVTIHIVRRCFVRRSYMRRSLCVHSHGCICSRQMIKGIVTGNSNKPIRFLFQSFFLPLSLCVRRVWVKIENTETQENNSHQAPSTEFEVRIISQGATRSVVHSKKINSTIRACKNWFFDVMFELYFGLQFAFLLVWNLLPSR